MAASGVMAMAAGLGPTGMAVPVTVLVVRSILLTVLSFSFAT